MLFADDVTLDSRPRFSSHTLSFPRTFTWSATKTSCGELVVMLVLLVWDECNDLLKTTTIIWHTGCVPSECICFSVNSCPQLTELTTVFTFIHQQPIPVYLWVTWGGHSNSIWVTWQATDSPRAWWEKVKSSLERYSCGWFCFVAQFEGIHSLQLDPQKSCWPLNLWDRFDGYVKWVSYEV